MERTPIHIAAGHTQFTWLQRVIAAEAESMAGLESVAEDHRVDIAAHDVVNQPHSFHIHNPIYI